MGELAAVAAGLGLAGLDPVGALVGIGAAAHGVRRGWLIVYGAVVLLGTTAFGVVLSLTVGSRLREVDWAELLPGGRLRVVIEIVLAALLVWWAVHRQRGTATPNARVQPTTGWALAGVGVVFALSAVLDPTFDAVVVVAAGADGLGAVVGAHLVWAVVSQMPLAVLVGVLLFDRHGRAVELVRRWWERSSGVLGWLGSLVIGAVGILLAADAVWFLATGESLIRVG